ncbi:hypothetical protein BJY52DRAFT_1187779 [Lactarius psammicola]|nr:hypothetical protein BJY52DRAFT_1187779 [Lactarius psammicola]
MLSPFSPSCSLPLPLSPPPPSSPHIVVGVHSATHGDSGVHSPAVEELAVPLPRLRTSFCSAASDAHAHVFSSLANKRPRPSRPVLGRPFDRPPFPPTLVFARQVARPPLRNPRCLSRVGDGDGIIVLGHPDLSSAAPSTDPRFPFGRRASANATTNPAQITSARASERSGARRSGRAFQERTTGGVHVPRRRAPPLSSPIAHTSEKNIHSHRSRSM